MAQNVWGADADALDDLARRLGEAARTMDAIAVRLSSQVVHAPWHGAGADRFRSDWSRSYRRQLSSAVSFLREGESVLHRNASQQRAASSAGPGATPGAGAAHTPRLRFHMPSALDWAALGLVSAQWMDRGQGLWESIEQLRQVTLTNRLFSALRLGGMSAGDLFRMSGRRIPVVGTLLGATEMLLAWRQNGTHSEEFATATVGLAGGTAAAYVAGPLGALAWSVGFDGTRAVLHATGGDAVLHQVGGSIGDVLYGDIPQVPEHDAAWLRSASPAELREWNAQLQAASRAASESVPERAAHWAGNQIGRLFR